MRFFERPATWFVLIAVLFELALAALAMGVGGIFHFWPLIGMAAGESPLSPPVAVGIGLLATAPMTLALAFVADSRWAVFARLGRQARQLLAPFVDGIWQVELLLVALAAGIGEEILFRGLLQAGLSRWWSGVTGGWGFAWVLSALIFGACHWISGVYALLAVFAGLYLGWLLIATDNLLVPITAHAMYDLAALVYLARQVRNSGEKW